MKRREFSRLMASIAAGSVTMPLLAHQTIGVALPDVVPVFDNELPSTLPANIQQLVSTILKTDYAAINTDWFGSIRIEGLLRFANRGFKPGLDYATNWFNYHVEHDGKLTDEQYKKQYEGPKARVLRDGPLTFAIYSANLGVAFPIHELYKLTKSNTAKRVCFDVADAILHYAGRDRFGMLAHDDFNYMDFAIPDTAYWATRANAIAATLSTDEGVADVYWKQAIFQLDQGIRYFLDKDKGLVRTGIFKGEAGTTYWCRSQGWLLWAIGGMLRYLPKTHPKFTGYCADMKLIADGIKKYQSPRGGIHVLADDPSTPEEVTSICMVLSALKEATRNGWIPNQYEDVFKKAWSFIQQSVDATGKIHNAYTGWAVPAEKKQTAKMDEREMGYVPGILLVAADEMTR